jgi:hypothetical protein
MDYSIQLDSDQRLGGFNSIQTAYLLYGTGKKLRHAGTFHTDENIIWPGDRMGELDAFDLGEISNYGFGMTCVYFGQDINCFQYLFLRV